MARPGGGLVRGWKAQPNRAGRDLGHGRFLEADGVWMDLAAICSASLDQISRA